MSQNAALKKELRRRMLSLRAEMPFAERAAADAAITEAVLAHPAVCAAQQILAYVSMPHEVGTGALLEALLRRGKTLGLPVCDTAAHTMQFYRLDDLSELETGAYRIPIPPTDPERLLTPDAETVCLVPMLACDHEGYRLGAGGGFYDRFLSEFPVQTIGICYAACLAAELPREPHDRALSCIITEQKTEVHYV